MRTLVEVLGGLALVAFGFVAGVRCGKKRQSRDSEGNQIRPREPLLRKTYNLLTGEWLLNGRANGGDIILIRAFLISLVLYVPATVLHSWANATWSFDFELHAIGRELSDTLPWLGAIFAGAYVALYTRFSAQWNYLAGVYNQIMAAECAHTGNPPKKQRENLDIWSAGFIEDAVTLHLATKKIFAEFIWMLLQYEGVRSAFDDSATAGVEMREQLERDLQRLHPQLVASPASDDAGEVADADPPAGDNPTFEITLQGTITRR